MLNPDKFDMKTLQICPPNLSDVATFGYPKSHFLSV